MRPSYPLYNTPDSSLIYIEVARKLWVRRSAKSIQIPNFFNLQFSQFSKASSFALRRIYAPFKMHISNILLLSTKKKMNRSYAFSIVALMKDQNIIRNRPEFHFPSYSVRYCITSLKIKPSISSRTKTGLPFPASSSGFFDFFPKFNIFIHDNRSSKGVF